MTIAFFCNGDDDCTDNDVAASTEASSSELFTHDGGLDADDDNSTVNDRECESQL